MWYSNTYVHHEMITTTKLSNVSITSYIYLCDENPKGLFSQQISSI